MNTSEIAEKFSSFNDYNLIQVYEAALPLWLISFDATVIASKKIDIIEEFILRSIDKGLTSLNEIANFLGLDEKFVKTTSAKLFANDCIQNDKKKLLLTQKGKAEIELSIKTQPRREEISIVYDGISRQPIVPASNWSLETSRVIKQWGLYEVPPLPGKPPSETDLEDIDFDRAIPKSVKQNLDIHQVISATKAGHNRRRYRQAFMLIYEGRSENDIVVRFSSQDGRMIEDVNKSFAVKNGIARLNLIKELEASKKIVNQELKINPEKKLIDQLLVKTQVEENKIKSSRRKLKAEIEVKSEKIESSIKFKDSKLEDEIKVLHSQIEKLEKESNKRKNRRLETYELIKVFDDALRNTKKRLLIISPWISDPVMDAKRLGEIEALLKRNVKTFIGYGMNDEKSKRTNPRAINKLNLLSKKFTNLTFKRFQNTHSKILAFDSSLVVGSYNWMSFSGTDYDRENRKQMYRHETALLTTETAAVEEEFKKYFK